MADEMEQFLSAEEAVQELLENLDKLRREIQGYSEARSCLDEAQGGLTELVTQTARLVEETQRVMKVLGKVGTPEILSRIETVQSSNANVAQLVQQSVQATNALAQAHAEAEAKVVSSVGKMVVTVQGALSGMTAEVARLIEVQRRSQAEGQANVTALLEVSRKAVEGRLEQSARSARRRGVVIVVLVILGVLVGAAGIALRFVKM